MNKYIVKLKKEHKDIPRKGKVKHEVEIIDAYISELNDAEVEELNLDPRVVYIERDMPIFAETIEATASWGLDRIDQLALPLDGTYNYWQTGEGVEAFIFDSGIRFSHQEFEGRARLGQDYINDGAYGNDLLGHGTHVAGIIGGREFGVAKKVTLYSMRVLDANGWGQISNLLLAIQWVTQRKAKGKYAKIPMVGNISIGYTGISPALDEGINVAAETGVIMCVAAGNRNMDASLISPGSAQGAICVGATDPNDIRAVYSNWGNVVELYAPGNVIPSAWASADDAVAYKTGTSMASPFVAGVVAMYLQENPKATMTEVLNALQVHASITPEGFNLVCSDFLN